MQLHETKTGYYERGRNNRESGRGKNKQKGVPMKMKQEIDSLTSYLGPKYKKKKKFNFQSKNEFWNYLQKYITYRQVPGYVNRYWNQLYKRKNYPPSYVNRYRGQIPSNININPKMNLYTN